MGNEALNSFNQFYHSSALNYAYALLNTISAINTGKNSGWNKRKSFRNQFERSLKRWLDDRTLKRKTTYAQLRYWFDRRAFQF